MTDFNTAFNITGMRAFKGHFPNKEKNATYSQSSYYPVNAPHFWVYDHQCAFTPQFPPLSKSASSTILGSRPQTVVGIIQKNPSFNKKIRYSQTSVNTDFIHALIPSLLLKHPHQICKKLTYHREVN